MRAKEEMGRWCARFKHRGSSLGCYVPESAEARNPHISRTNSSGIQKHCCEATGFVIIRRACMALIVANLTPFRVE